MKPLKLTGTVYPNCHYSKDPPCCYNGAVLYEHFRTSSNDTEEAGLYDDFPQLVTLFRSIAGSTRSYN